MYKQKRNLILFVSLEIMTESKEVVSSLILRIVFVVRIILSVRVVQNLQNH